MNTDQTSSSERHHPVGSRSGLRVARSRTSIFRLLCAGVLLLGYRANAGTPATKEYWVEEVTQGLNFPSSMAWLPDGEILIPEQMGDLRRFRSQKLDPLPVKGVPKSFPRVYDGLKDIAIDPEYPANHRIYLLISEGSFAERHAAVYRARYDDGVLYDLTRIFRSKDGVGGAGSGVIATRMLFLADQTLLVSVAEDHKLRAQDLSSHLGKLVRIDRDGSVPPDNPFLNTPGALPEIWSYGHRVPLGLWQDPQTGTMLEIESGPRGGDELNILKPGGNYGWAKATWGFAYNNGGLDAPLQSAPGIEDPILIWMPSATPSGLTRYQGSRYPDWNGDYFVGLLTTKALERLRIKGRRVILREEMLVDLEERIRDVKVGLDGYIYVLTDSSNGRLLRLRPGRPRLHEKDHVARKLAPIIVPLAPDGGAAMLAAADPSAGARAFRDRCSSCHSVGATAEGATIGPNLSGVYGRLMGRAVGFDYSANMADSWLTWDFTTLDRFLADPSAFVPGTKMAAPPVSDPQTRLQIIAFLKQQTQP